MIWSHGMDELIESVALLNSLHRNIKYTMEQEVDGKLPFLDILLMKKPDGTLGSTVFRRPTHTNLYVNNQIHHHPAQKDVVLAPLVHRAVDIADKEHLNEELQTLRHVWTQNGLILGRWTGL